MPLLSRLARGKGGCHVVASIDVERCAAKIMAKFTRRNLHAWVTRCFGAESEKWSGNRPFQRRGLGSIEGGVGIRAGTEGPGGGRCVRGRTGVFRSPPDCGSGAEFAGGIRLPNLSKRGSYPFPGERCRSGQGRV